MKYRVTFSSDEVRVTLTESLKLPEGRSLHFGQPDAPNRFDLLPEIQTLVRQFLNGFAVDRGGLQQQFPLPDCRRHQSLRESSP